ncbi:hypothetical protein KBD81_00370 [Candidatus Woesebacteria bacterium]|nr:hypothetical protein [Candidatus Woesebacteria bacterium]
MQEREPINAIRNWLNAPLDMSKRNTGKILAGGLAVGAAAYALSPRIAFGEQREQATPIATGTLPFFEDLPKPFEIISNPHGYEFRKVVKPVNIRAEQNDAALKVQEKPLQVEDALQVVPPIVDLSGTVKEVGGDNIPDNKDGQNTWTRAKKINEPNIQGFVAEGTLDDPYLSPLAFDELSPEQQANYIEELVVPLPAAPDTKDLTLVFERSSAVGGANDIDNTIATLWGHEFKSTSIRQGSKLVFSEPKTPTRDELNVAVHAWQRVVGLAAISVSEPHLPDDLQLDPDGIRELTGAGGMKAVSITVDAQEVESDPETFPAPSMHDIVTRVGDFFIISRVAMSAAQGTVKAINEVKNVARADWGGLQLILEIPQKLPE